MNEKQWQQLLTPAITSYAVDKVPDDLDLWSKARSRYEREATRQAARRQARGMISTLSSLIVVMLFFNPAFGLPTALIGSSHLSHGASEIDETADYPNRELYMMENSLVYVLNPTYYLEDVTWQKRRELVLPTDKDLKPGGPARIVSTGGDYLRVREGAGTNYNIKGLVGPGDQVWILDGPTRAGDKAWYRISFGNRVGWVGGRYLAAEDIKTSEAGTSTGKVSTSSVTAPSVASATEIVRIGSRYIGARYRYAGTTPAGFDSSGFVYYVFNQAGIAMPRSMLSQIARGTRISSKDLQPGDLVYFSNTYKRGISHIAIYVGFGKIVHVSDRLNGVTRSDLWSPYWASHYTGAVRIQY